MKRLFTMSKVLSLFLLSLTLLIACTASPPAVSDPDESVPGRSVTEQLIVQIDWFKWIRESFKVSPDARRV